MGDFRTVASARALGSLERLLTYIRDDHRCDGTWSKPDVPLLIYAEHSLEGTAVSFNDGPIAAGAQGHPIQLLFWGAWWNTPVGVERRQTFEYWAKAMLDSPYFTELAQYGIPRAPVWRDSLIVTQPGPPMNASGKLVGQRLVSMVDDLIDDGVISDPDDGPRAMYIALLPDGFSIIGETFEGAHKSDYDWDFPFDRDRFWAGWVRPQVEGPELVMTVISHEIVEMMTDPEGDGWTTGAGGAHDEISDAGDIHKGLERQTAFVNDAPVQSYWSNRHDASIIPIDRDYAARLVATVAETSRRVADSGKFRPDAVAGLGGPAFRACRIEDRDYSWQVHSIAEAAKIRLQTQRYRKPRMEWTINGVAVSGSGDLTFPLTVEGFDGNTPIVTANKPVTLHYRVRPAGLDLSASAAGGNFDIPVGCRVTDASFGGKLAVQPVATPQLVVGFVGAELVLDPDYMRQLEQCLRAMIARFVRQYKPTGKPGPGDPIDHDFKALIRNLPAHVRMTEYRRIREAAKAARAASTMLEPAIAASFMRRIVRSIPVLERRKRASLLERRRSGRRSRSSTK